MSKLELGIIAAIIFIVVSAPFLAEAECKAKTEDMGFNVKWNFIGGCRIEHEAGKWIPLERYRVIED